MARRTHSANIPSPSPPLITSTATATSTTQHNRHLINHLFTRFSRRTRFLFTLISISTLISLYCLQRRTTSDPWRSFRSSSDTKLKTRPTLTRDVLDRLESLDESQLKDEELAVEELMYSNKSTPNHSHRLSSPLLTSLPTQKRISKNKKTCPDNLPYPCGFLVAGYVSAEDPKAQVDLHQLGLLALALNRTLVLPQLSQSRMGSCLEYPFDLYYQSDALDLLGVRTVTHEKFVRWLTNSNLDGPSARLLAIVSRQQLPSAPPQGSVTYDRSADLRHPSLSFAPARKFCLHNPSASKLKNTKLDFNFGTFPPLTIVAPDDWHQSDEHRARFADHLVRAVRESDDLGPTHPSAPTPRPDILVANYELVYPFLDPSSSQTRTLLGVSGPETSGSLVLKAFDHFPYALIWGELVEELVRRQPAMIGVHWRQETVPTADLHRCAQTLVPTLGSIHSHYPSLQTVYLATDYALEQAGGAAADARQEMMRGLVGAQLPSGLRWLTFDGLVDGVELSGGLLAKLLELPFFGDLRAQGRRLQLGRLNMRLDGRAPAAALARTVAARLRPADPGLAAILDALLLLRAPFFLAPVPGTCAKPSAFAAHVVRARLRRQDHTALSTGYPVAYYPPNDPTAPHAFNLVEFWS